jgi:hypothetical protein
MVEKTTKWSVLTGRLAALREQAGKIESELEWMRRTAFGSPCSGCGQMLDTEADFAQHFVISSAAYLNIGACPVIAVRNAL